MNRYLCNNTERYEIPEWARAENMEACCSQAKLWNMSEQVVKEKRRGNKFRRHSPSDFFWAALFSIT